MTNGAEYLFVARDEAEVQSWVSAINSAIEKATEDPALMDIAIRPLTSVATPPVSAKFGEPWDEGKVKTQETSSKLYAFRLLLIVTVYNSLTLEPLTHTVRTPWLSCPVVI